MSDNSSSGSQSDINCLQTDTPSIDSDEVDPKEGNDAVCQDFFKNKLAESVLLDSSFTNIAESGSTTNESSSDWSATTQTSETSQSTIITMTQNIPICDFGNRIAMKSDISLAKQLETVYGRRLTAAELIASSWRNSWFPNMELKIGNSILHIDRYLFYYYVETFKDRDNRCLELPTHKVSKQLMTNICNWFINEDYQLPVGDDFLLVYEMSKFLGIRRLQEQFWHTFSTSSNEQLWDFNAFAEYVKARDIKCLELMPILMSRIRKFFLPLVASIEFLQFDVSELTNLLKFDTISVNNEDEVFFAVIRWLEFDWSNRKKYVVELMKKIRLRLISPWLQRSILYQPENKLIRELGTNEEVKALLWDSCLYGAAVAASKKYPDSCDRMMMHLISQGKGMQRYWIYCPGVPHHHDIKCPHFRPLSYHTFKAFLICLQSNSKTFMDTIKYSPEKQWNSYECCLDCLKEGKRIWPPMYRMDF